MLCCQRLRATNLKLIKQKTCKHCKEKFTPSSTTQVACGFSCALSIAKADAGKKLKVLAEKEKRAAKDRIKSRADHLKDAQAAFNAFIRARDAGQPCISCQRNTGCKMNAGHYLSVGARPELRFTELNCHIQCEKCNSFLSGNIVLYRQNLITKIGADTVEWLEGSHAPLHLSVDDIKQIKEKYRAKLKALKMESFAN